MKPSSPRTNHLIAQESRVKVKEMILGPMFDLLPSGLHTWHGSYRLQMIADFYLSNMRFSGLPGLITGRYLLMFVEKGCQIVSGNFVYFIFLGLGFCTKRRVQGPCFRQFFAVICSLRYRCCCLWQTWVYLNLGFIQVGFKVQGLRFFEGLRLVQRLSRFGLEGLFKVGLGLV